MRVTRPITRRQFLLAAGFGGGGLLLGYMRYVEPFRITVSEQSIRSRGASGEVRTRFVQLSDLHFGRLDYHKKKVARRVADMKPDFVVITGDAFNGAGDVESFAGFLDLLGGIPVYGVTGNREHSSKVGLGEMDALYRKHGGRLLSNESLLLRQGGAEILLTGIDDKRFGPREIAAAFREIAPTANHLVLAHRPRIWERLRPFLSTKPEIEPCGLLAGHTHGGQVNLFGLPIHMPSGSGRYRYGWYHREETLPLFISRGVGTTGIRLRFMAPPEIALFDWQLAGKREAGPYEVRS